MTTYVVTYDLVGEEDSSGYSDLRAALKKLDGHKYQLSAWLIDTPMTSKQVVEFLSEHMDDNDRLWVSELTSSRWYKNAMPGTNDWLSIHLPNR